MNTLENDRCNEVFSHFKKHSRQWQALEFRDGKFTDVKDSGQIRIIDIERIHPSANQPRQIFDDTSIVNLANSIKRHGIIHPIIVRKAAEVAGNGDLFEIIAGERRLRAAKLLGAHEIPCIVLEADELRSAEISIIENTQREDLNFFDEATAIASLIKLHGLTQEDAAERLSVSQSYIANKMRILRLTPEERKKILEYALSERHARALLRISSPSERLRAIEYIYTHNLNVAATETYIEQHIGEKAPVRNNSFSKRVVLKDIRVFYNSVERAISTIKQAGINVESNRVEENGVTVLTIRIANDVSRETS